MLRKVEVAEMEEVMRHGVADARLPVNYEAALIALRRALRARPSTFQAAHAAAVAALKDCLLTDECAGWSSKAQAMKSYARQADDAGLDRLAKRVSAKARRVELCGGRR